MATALVLYLHGGGWVIGDLETHDRACRRLAAASGVSVLALDYRRAPEHPWPAAVDDAVAALQWIASQPAELEVTPRAVAIAGDSAGVPTTARREQGMVHNFLLWDTISPACAAAADRVAADLAAAVKPGDG